MFGTDDRCLFYYRAQQNKILLKGDAAERYFVYVH